MKSSSPTRGQKNTVARLALALLVVVLVAIALVLLASQYAAGRQPAISTPAISTAIPTPTVAAASPQSTAAPKDTQLPSAITTQSPIATATQAATVSPSPATSSAAEQTLQALEAEQVPVRDLYSITLRLKLKADAPLSRTVEGSGGNYVVGHTDMFYMSDIIAKRYYTITATLLNVTEHAYWYVQDGQQVEDSVLEDASRAFEQQIYPTDHRLFGTEWVPGVDNDPRMTVLIARIPGAGGYFVSADEYTQSVNPFSNQREIIYVGNGGDVSGLGSTLAHEFQHMIHWHENPGHDVWINEGASMLAQDINGYGAGGVEQAFVTHPDLQLNAWQSNPDSARGNYGASFLFFDFLMSHYGGDRAVRALVAAKGRGADAVNNALKDLGSKDDFLSVFKRWTLANLLDGEQGADDQGLDYPGREVKVSPQHLVDDYPRSLADTVSQFGTDYIELALPDSGSTLQISFRGDKETRLIPSPARSGEYIWWSNRGDQADSSMTRHFDLRGLPSATLNFSTWFNIEDDLDYGYVEASTDNGATWTALQGDYTTSSNPNGNNLGYGYTGKSADKPGADPNGWLQERIDLSNYVGKEVLLRFEYITDDGFNMEGMAVDDISVPELAYSDDAEADTGWEGEGFVRVANKLPQTFRLAVIKYKQSGFDVQEVEVGPDGTASFDVAGLGGAGPYKRAVLLVSGTNRYSILPAGYELNIKLKP